MLGRPASCSLAALAFAAVVMSCRDASDGTPAEPSAPTRDEDAGREEASRAAAGDGNHRIRVPLADGTFDDVWIRASSPSGAGPYPVVVYAHGQGLEHYPNCSPKGVPSDATLAGAAAFIDGVARAGYLGVAIAFRNAGDGAPPVGTLKLRDLGVLDARALLAAAQWAVREHGKGSQDVAFVGGSNGSFPAFWAVTPRPELADLQGGLRPRTFVILGHTANAVANVGRTRANFDPAASAAQRGQAIVQAVLAVLAAYAPPEVTPADLRPGTPTGDAVASALTPKGRDLLEKLALTPATAAATGCAGLDGTTPILCAPACLTNALLAGGDDPGPLTDWMTPSTIDAMTYWVPATGSPDPVGTPNRLLAAFRATSPTYAAQGPLLAPRALPLLSTSDHVLYGPRGQGAPAVELFLARLGALGVQQIDRRPLIDADAKGPCGHEDYLDEARPDCGYRALLEELRSAFGR